MLAVLPLGNAYEFMAMLHILSATVAFGPLFAYPTFKKSGDTQALAALHMRLTFPALVALWVLGMGLAGMSEDAYKMSQVWLALSLANWAIVLVVSWFLIRPAIADTSEPATSKLAAGVGVTHVGLVVGLVLMIWKPGL